MHFYKHMFHILLLCAFMVSRQFSMAKLNVIFEGSSKVKNTNAIQMLLLGRSESLATKTKEGVS
jgi:hypothetical protein